jgi:hypothetical protein
VRHVFPQTGAVEINDVVLQGDGKIVAAGYIDAANFALARYLSNGALDANFGLGGTVNTDFGGTDVADAVTVIPDGRIVAAGRSQARRRIAGCEVKGDG